MSSLDPNVKSVDQTNRATPLAESFLKILQGQMDQGSFGTGVGPLQREAGTSARQLVGSLGGDQKVNTEGALQDYTKQLTDSVSAKAKSNLSDSEASLRQQFNQGGNRFSSAFARGDARLQSDSNMNLNTLISTILTDQGTKQQSAREFDVNANQAHNTQFLNAINSLFNQGEANTDPFSKFSSQGIINPETIVSPSVGSQLLGAGSSILGDYLKGGGRFGLGGGNNGIADAYKSTKQFKMPKIGGGTVGNPTVVGGPNGNNPSLNPGMNWQDILGRRDFQ